MSASNSLYAISILTTLKEFNQGLITMNYLRIKKPKTAKINFNRILKNRLALSTVVTTLIILVISVLLASVVTYFAINVVSTRVQEESLALANAQVWLNHDASPGEPAYSQASIMVINTGGRDVVINKIAVRGQDCTWTAASQFIVYSITNQPVTGNMNFQPTMAAAGQNPVAQNLKLDPEDTHSKAYSFSYSRSSLVLRSGYSMLIYVVNPDSITINDIGLTVSVTLYTAQAMYYRETNVQAYVEPVVAQGGDGGEEPQAADITVNDAEAYYGAEGSQGALVVTNNEAAAITITSVTLNAHAGTGLYDAVGAFGAVADLEYIPVLNGGAHDGHNLASVNSVVIPAGQKAIIYYSCDASLVADDVTTQVDFVLGITGFQAYTGHLTVETVPE